MSAVTLCCVCRLLENECCNSCVVCACYWRMSAVTLCCVCRLLENECCNSVLCVQVTGE